MDAIAWIAEQRIREAMDQGFFDNSPYRGRRVHLEEDQSIAPELRMAFKVLKDAGCLPPEVELRREIATLSELLDTIAAEGEERQRLRRELHDRRLRLELLRRHR
jgi:signal transduction histidine kinase